ncbi:FAD binding domain protein [Mycobacterium xenopi 3993]|nr:FAD binding domain protein [Mycobacterium xenopi 3993]
MVGSGAGGAMAARGLARAGLQTVVLEEGRRWTVEEFRTRHPIDRYAGLYRGAGRRSRWDARPWCCRSGARSVAPPSSTPAPAIARR